MFYIRGTWWKYSSSSSSLSLSLHYLPSSSSLIIMTLAGKITTEIGVHATAEKWFNLFAKQLHHVQNLAERVHGTKLHHGEDWHHPESIKHWTYVIGNSTSDNSVTRNPNVVFSFNLILNNMLDLFLYLLYNCDIGF